jgi:protoporphyrinogen oxidase
VHVNLAEVIEGAEKRLSPARTYFYPSQGNISVLSEAMAKSAGPIVFDSPVTNIDLHNKRVTSGQQQIGFDHLISTLPLNYAASMTGSLPNSLLEASKQKLSGLRIKVLNLVFEGNHELEGTATYFPEKQFIFRRVSVLQNLCPALRREGLTPLSVEVSVGAASTVGSDKDLLGRVLKDLQLVPQFAQLGTPKAHQVLSVDFAYPLQVKGLRHLVDELHDYYRKFDVYHCGRGGNFDYCNADRAYLQGKQAVQGILGSPAGGGYAG